jgi:hypothetical protein
MRISRPLSPVQIIVDQKQLENVEYFNYLGDTKFAREIKSSFAIAKNGIQAEGEFFHQQFGLKFKEETSLILHFEHTFVWC